MSEESSRLHWRPRASLPDGPYEQPVQLRALAEYIWEVIHAEIPQPELLRHLLFTSGMATAALRKAASELEAREK